MEMWRQQGKMLEDKLGHHMPEHAKRLLWLCRSQEKLAFCPEWLIMMMSANLLFGFTFHHLRVVGHH